MYCVVNSYHHPLGGSVDLTEHSGTDRVNSRRGPLTYIIVRLSGHICYCFESKV